MQNTCEYDASLYERGTGLEEQNLLYFLKQNHSIQYTHIHAIQLMESAVQDCTVEYISTRQYSIVQQYSIVPRLGKCLFPRKGVQFSTNPSSFVIYILLYKKTCIFTSNCQNFLQIAQFPVKELPSLNLPNFFYPCYSTVSLL